jgi:hypothetical protein
MLETYEIRKIYLKSHKYYGLGEQKLTDKMINHSYYRSSSKECKLRLREASALVSIRISSIIFEQLDVSTPINVNS